MFDALQCYSLSSGIEYALDPRARQQSPCLLTRPPRSCTRRGMPRGSPPPPSGFHHAGGHADRHVQVAHVAVRLCAVLIRLVGMNEMQVHGEERRIVDGQSDVVRRGRRHLVVHHDHDGGGEDASSTYSSASFLVSKPPEASSFEVEASLPSFRAVSEIYIGGSGHRVRIVREGNTNKALDMQLHSRRGLQMCLYLYART